MIKIQIGYIKEGPSADLADFHTRINYEFKVYAMLNEFQQAGICIAWESDGHEYMGKRYYAVFDTEEEAAIFKLTKL